MPHSVSSLSPWHESDEIDPDLLGIDFHFVYIKKRRPPQSSTLHGTKCIERMSMWLIASIAHLDKYCPLSIPSNNINLPSLDLIIACDDSISLFFEIPQSYIFPFISDTSARWFFSEVCHHGKRSKLRKSKLSHLGWMRYVAVTKYQSLGL